MTISKQSVVQSHSDEFELAIVVIHQLLCDYDDAIEKAYQECDFVRHANLSREKKGVLVVNAALQKSQFKPNTGPDGRD